MKTAISYRRFSTPEQAQGDSERRQNEAFLRFCKRHGLEPGEVMIDRGLSGFHGIHRSQGAFGRFLASVEAGEIRIGTTLVIEAWDRFSRERPDTALATLVKILEAGISVGVDSLDMILTAADLDKPQMQWVYSDMMRSRQESKRKSEIGKANRAEIRKTGLTKSGNRVAACPFWLTVEGDKYVVVSEAKRFVKRVFDLSAEGRGAKEIGTMLDTHKNILGILRNRAVIGEYQPCERIGKTEKKPIGNPIADYYPAIIEREDFFTVQKALDSRRLCRGRRGKGGNPTNLFTDVFFGSDRQTMYVKGLASGKRILMRRSSDTPKGEYRTWEYAPLETALLRFLGELTLTGTVQSPVEDYQAELADVEKRLDAIRKRLERDSDLETLLDMVSSLEGRRKALRGKIEAEKGRIPETHTLDQTKGILAGLAAASGAELIEMRVRLKAQIRRLVTRIEVCFGANGVAMLDIKLANGENRIVKVTKSRRRMPVTHAVVCDSSGTTEVWRIKVS